MKLNIKNIINLFLHSPQKLFWYFILLNIIPSVCLLFTEPFNFLGKTILILFPLGLYFCLLSLKKNLGLMQLILFPLLFLHAFQLVLFYLFGEEVIAVDMFLNLTSTNATEAGELLDSIWPSVVLVIVLYIPTTILAAIICKRKIYLDFSFRKNIILAGLIIMLAGYGLTFYAKNKNTGDFNLHRDVYPINVFYNLGFAINKSYLISKYETTSENFTFNASKANDSNNREIYILVIGETSRAENWSLYGYSRETNPLLKQDSVFILEDVITQSNTTHKSVPIILTSASAENFNVIYSQKSIIHAFKEVGFTTVFISNQTPNHSFIEYFSREADFFHTIRPASNVIASVENRLDEEMLPIVKKYLDSIHGNIFVVINQYGSHFNYKERYSEIFSVFKPDDVTEISKKQKEKLINAYDNSILYTDYFLHKTIKLLDSYNIQSALYFVSDHGEDLLDDNRQRFLHASPSPTFYQLRIPMFLWFSQKYKANIPYKIEALNINRYKPVATNSVFHTMLDIAQIKTDYLKQNLSLVDTSFRIVKRMYLNDHDKPIFFYNANLKKIDKELINERKIYH